MTDNCSRTLLAGSEYNTAEIAVFGYVKPTLCLAGVICNLLAIWVVTDRRLRYRSVYTYLAYLSACDAISLLIAATFNVFAYHFPGKMEMFVNAAVAPIFIMSTAWSLSLTLTITIDRFVHVRKFAADEIETARNRRCFNKGHVVSIGVFFATVALNGPMLMVFHLNTNTWCLELQPWARIQDGWFAYYSLTRVIICKFGVILALIVCNALLFWTIQRSRFFNENVGAGTENFKLRISNAPARAAAQRSLSLTLFAAGLLSLLCEISWAIFSPWTSAIFFGTADVLKVQPIRSIYLLCELLVVVEYSGNFIIYCTMGKKFRAILFEKLHLPVEEHAIITPPVRSEASGADKATKTLSNQE